MPRHLLLSLLALLALLTACSSTSDEAPATDPAAVPAPSVAPAPMPILAGQVDLSDPVPTDPAVRIGTLDNGLRWYVRQNAKPEQRASLFLTVGAGSVDEDDDQKGLAHMAEHMAFNGTENFPEQDLVNFLESVGMSFGPEVNAFTSLDQTVYMLQVPTDDAELLDTGLRILEEWAHRVSFEDEEIDKERGVIIEEWRSGLGADDRIFDEQMPVRFHDSKYAERRTIGDHEIIASFEHDVIRRYYRDWYRPDLQAVIAVGDFDSDAMIARIEELFGAMPMAASPRPQEQPPVPDHEETLYSVITDPEATRTSVSLQWKHEPATVETVGDWRGRLALSLGSSMLRSRFSEMTQEADPPFAMAFAGYRRQVRTMSSFSFMAFMPEDKAAVALEALALEAERLRRHGFTQGELDRARIDLLRSLESRTEEVDKTPSRRWSFQYMQHFLYDQPIPGPSNQLQLARQLVPGITLEEVTSAITSLMTDENRVVMISGPEKEGLDWPSEATLAGILGAAVVADVAPYTEEIVDQPLVAVTPAPVAITERTEDIELGTVTWTLANDVTVVLKPTDFNNDKVLMRAYSWGGTSIIDDDAESRRVQFATSVVGNNGVGAFDKIALDKALTGKIAGSNPLISEFTQGFRGQASPRDLETMCQLVYLQATQPRDDPEAFASWQERMSTWFANRDADPMNALRDTVSVLVSGGDPRQAPFTAAELDAVDPAESLAFYRDRFADCSGMTFFFVGNVDPVAFEPMARTWLGNLPSTGVGATWVDRYPEPPRGVIEDTVVKGLDPKGYVQMVFAGESPWSPEAGYALECMTAALRIRLRQEVREEKSGTYGVRFGGRLTQVPREGYYLSLGWGCDPERTEELTETVWAVIEEMQTDGPDEETMGKVRETQLREDQTNLKDNRFWLRHLGKHHMEGTDPHGILTRPDEVATLSATMIRDAARLYLDRNNHVRVVLQPEPQTP